MSMALNILNQLESHGGPAWKRFQLLTAAAERAPHGSQQNQELAEYQRELQADLPAVLRRHHVEGELLRKQATEAEAKFHDMALVAESAFFDVFVAARTAYVTALAEADRTFRAAIMSASAATKVDPGLVLKGPGATARAAKIGESAAAPGPVPVPSPSPARGLFARSK